MKRIIAYFPGLFLFFGGCGKAPSAENNTEASNTSAATVSETESNVLFCATQICPAYLRRNKMFLC